MADSFWAASSHAGSSSELGRNTSEWAFQRHLHSNASTSFPSSSSPEISNVDGRGGGGDSNGLVGSVFRSKKNASTLPHVDSADYQALLKQRLDLACAAVAMARASGVKSHLPPLADNGHHSSERSELCSHSSIKDWVEYRHQHADTGIPTQYILDRVWVRPNPNHFHNLSTFCFHSRVSTLPGFQLQQSTITGAENFNGRRRRHPVASGGSWRFSFRVNKHLGFHASSWVFWVWVFHVDLGMFSFEDWTVNLSIFILFFNVMCHFVDLGILQIGDFADFSLVVWFFIVVVAVTFCMLLIFFSVA